MQHAEGHRRSIHRILSQCSDHELFKEETRYFLQKSHEMKQVQSKLDSSIRQLRTLQNDESEEQPPNQNVEMAETFYAQQSQPKLMQVKSLMDSPEKHNKFKFRSLASQQSKLYLPNSNRSPRSPINKLITVSQTRINLPNLLFKMRKGKLPTNASRNKHIEYERLRQQKTEQDDLTYEKIKIQRRKLQETRHLLILGKVYDENYRKDLRNLWALKIKRKRKLKI